MRNLAILMFTVLLPLLGGCAGPTSIKNVALPPVTTIEGKVTQIDKGGFTLTDHSGSIYVRAELPDNKSPDLSIGEKVRVFGNLQGGQTRIFDGYVIRRSTGEQIIVTNPTPHFGFVIQSSFR